MIVDFILMAFDEECPLLEIRMAELKGLVDLFVIVESLRTHQGAPKQPLDANAIRDIADKHNSEWQLLTHHGGDQSETDPWKRVAAHRNTITDSRLFRMLPPDTWTLQGDVDEIPRARVVREVSELRHRRGGTLLMTEHWMFLNTLGNRFVHGTRFIQKSMMQGVLETADGVRQTPMQAVLSGGWHLSFLGTASVVQRKLATYAHAELNVPPWNTTEWIEKCRNELADLFGAGDHKLAITGTDDLPKFVKDNEARFREMGWIK